MDYFAYIDMSSYDKVAQAKSVLIKAGVHEKNIFINDDQDSKIEINYEKQPNAWSHLLSSIHTGDQLFVSDLSNLILSDTDTWDKVQDRLYPLIDKEVVIISLREDIQLTQTNFQFFFKCIHAAEKLHEQITSERTRLAMLASNHRKGRKPRTLGDKAGLYRYAYDYIQAGHTLVETARTFGISPSTAHRIKKDFSAMEK